MEAEVTAIKRDRRRSDIAICVLGFIAGCFVMTVICFAYSIHATFSMSENEDFVTARFIANRPEVQRQRRLGLERLIGVRLPETTVVTRMRELFGPDSVYTAEFETSEQEASKIIARLDEIRPVIPPEEIGELGSVFTDGPIQDPVRAWMLPAWSAPETFVIRLVEIRDGKAVWVVEDFF